MTLTAEARGRILADMRDGFHDDEILDRLLADVAPLRYRGVMRGDLETAITELRREFSRGHPGRPSLSARVLAYRWQQAVALAGSDKLPAVARHYRMQGGSVGIPDEAALESRMRHLRRLRKRLLAE